MIFHIKFVGIWTKRGVQTTMFGGKKMKKGEYKAVRTVQSTN